MDTYLLSKEHAFSDLHQFLIIGDIILKIKVWCFLNSCFLYSPPRGFFNVVFNDISWSAVPLAVIRMKPRGGKYVFYMHDTTVFFTAVKHFVFLESSVLCIIKLNLAHPKELRDSTKTSHSLREVSNLLRAAFRITDCAKFMKAKDSKRCSSWHSLHTVS